MYKNPHCWIEKLQYYLSCEILWQNDKGNTRRKLFYTHTKNKLEYELSMSQE